MCVDDEDEQGGGMKRLCKDTNGREGHVRSSGWRSRRIKLVIGMVVETSANVNNHV